MSLVIFVISVDEDYYKKGKTQLLIYTRKIKTSF
jgi:hypothetical protein